MSPAPTYKGMQELVIGQSIFSYMRFLILSTCGALFTSIANHLLCSFYQHQHCHFELLIGSEGEHWSPVVVIGDHWYRSVSYASVSQWPLVNITNGLQCWSPMREVHIAKSFLLIHIFYCCRKSTTKYQLHRR